MSKSSNKKFLMKKINESNEWLIVKGEEISIFYFTDLKNKLT